MVRKGEGMSGGDSPRRGATKHVILSVPVGHLADTLSEIAEKRAAMKKDARCIAGYKRETRRLLDEMEARG